MKLSDDSILSALIAYGSPTAAAKALGCSTQPIYTRLRCKNRHPSPICTQF